MAVIRCPSCNKPNPDSIEICQYCDAVMKPGSSAAPTVGVRSGTVRCPSCGEPNPAFLDACQFCETPLSGAPLEPASAPSAAPHPTVGTDWLISVRTPSAEKGSDALPDWLQAMQAPAAPADETPDWMSASSPAPTSALAPLPADDDMPDWLRGMQPQGASAPPTAAPPPLAANDDVPDWLRAMQPAGANEAPTAAPPPMAANDDVPDWLRAMQPAGASEAPTAAPPPMAANDDVPDWLRAMQPAGASEAPTAAPPHMALSDDVPDWLRGMQPEASAPAFADTPTWRPTADEPPPPMAAPADDIPEWMRGEASFAAPTTPAAAPADDIPDWMRGSAPLTPVVAPADDVPEWMRGSAPSAPATAPADDIPDWMRGSAPLTPAAAPADDVPDWMRGSAPSAPAAAPVDDIPDWMRGSAPLTPAAAPADDVPDWMRGSAPSAPAAAPADDIPDWMRGSAPLTPTAPANDVPDWMRDSSTAFATPTAAPADDTPDWMRDSGAAFATPAAEPTPAGDVPDWMSSMRGGDAFSAAPVSDSSGDDWMSSLRGEPTPASGMEMHGGMDIAETDDALAGMSAPAGGLQQTALPNWLAAMRPVEVELPGLADDADSYEERVGVLAGMQSVLRAEPSVAMPHKSMVQAQRIEVSPDQSRQAEVFTTLITVAEEAAKAIKAPRSVMPLVERLLVVLVLVALVATPLFVMPGLFPLPKLISRDAKAAFDVIETLPSQKPALVAFDYDVGQSSELEPAASAIVEHLLRRGIPVVGMSLQPAGAGLGDAVLETSALHLSSTFSYTYGANYLNLGYLGGGPLGLAQFARQPRTSFVADFRRARPDVWRSEILSPIDSITQFGVVVVVSATPEDVRAWVEQVRPGLGDVPLLAVVSAGAEPLVRPYLESSDPTRKPALKGLVSGFVGGTQYLLQANIAPSDAVKWNWDALGGGLMAALILITLGNLMGGVAGLVQRRRKR